MIPIHPELQAVGVIWGTIVAVAAVWEPGARPTTTTKPRHRAGLLP